VSLLQPARDPFVRRALAARLSNLGRLYFERGDPARASALFEAALAERPGDAAAATNLAVAHAQAGDLLVAAKIVDEVLAREPLRATARLNAARYHLRLGDRDRAAADLAFLRAHALAPESELAPLEKELHR
jgi:tetratricopeptide (TPR) repeat protein